MVILKILAICIFMNGLLVYGLAYGLLFIERMETAKEDRQNIWSFIVDLFRAIWCIPLIIILNTIKAAKD